MATIIVVAAVAVLFGLAVRHIVKQQKQGDAAAVAGIAVGAEAPVREIENIDIGPG